MVVGRVVANPETAAIVLACSELVGVAAVVQPAAVAVPAVAVDSADPAAVLAVAADFADFVVEHVVVAAYFGLAVVAAEPAVAADSAPEPDAGLSVVVCFDLAVVVEPAGPSVVVCSGPAAELAVAADLVSFVALYFDLSALAFVLVPARWLVC
jgi:hypothetical protein